jgi:hypothetical protein
MERGSLPRAFLGATGNMELHHCVRLINGERPRGGLMSFRLGHSGELVDSEESRRALGSTFPAK